MGLFNIFSGSKEPDTGTEQRSLSLFNTDPLPPMHYYGISDEAVVQGSDNAMAVSAFHACVRAISDSVSGLPWNVYKRDDDGNTPYKAHPYNFLLSQQPNNYQTSFEFRSTLLTNCCVWGNAYALKTTGQDGLVTAMTPLHPLYVTPRELESGEIVFDYYAADGQQTGRFTSRQVIHVRYLSDNGWKGLCPLNLLAPIIKLARLMDIASQRFWNNDARPSVILESSQPIPEPAMKTLARSWNTMFKGPLNTGKTCVLPNGITAREFAPSSAVDSDLVAVRQFLVEEIARGMRVPASMIGGQGGSYEDDMLRFTQQTVTPWVNRMESAFQRGLFNQEEELNNQIDVRGLMRGDSSSRANYYASLFNMAAMSPNDVRRAEELPPLETEAADNTYIPLNNFSPLQIAAQQGLKATGEGTAEEPQEAEGEAVQKPEGGPNGETLQEVSLNGAQVSGIIEILNQISAGLIDKPAGKVLIEAAFPTIPSSMVSSIVDGTNDVSDAAPPPEQPTQEPTNARKKATRKKATKKKSTKTRTPRSSSK